MPACMLGPALANANGAPCHGKNIVHALQGGAHLVSHEVVGAHDAPHVFQCLNRCSITSEDACARCQLVAKPGHRVAELRAPGRQLLAQLLQPRLTVHLHQAITNLTFPRTEGLPRTPWQRMSETVTLNRSTHICRELSHINIYTGAGAFVRSRLQQVLQKAAQPAAMDLVGFQAPQGMQIHPSDLRFQTIVA